MNVYLSVDLDYWCRSRKQQCNAFFERVYALDLPIHVACEHHHLIDTMEGDFDTLINVDWHSDLCETPDEGWVPEDLNEGTWGNFVSWRERGTFIWRYPSAACLTTGIGYCHDKDNPFEKPVSGWRTVRKRRGTAGIPWESIKAVGVCLSPSWIGPEAVIQDQINRLGMQDWLELDKFGLFLPDKIVTIVPPGGKNVCKRGFSLAKCQE
jgi:hypothetical protein